MGMFLAYLSLCYYVSYMGHLGVVQFQMVFWAIRELCLIVVSGFPHDAES